MHEVAHVDISIDRDSGVPAYRQIYQQICSQIAAGSIPAGALIPKIRDLATDLGVARNTVEAAYRQLSLEGFASGKRGVGYVVEELDFSSVERQLSSESPASTTVHLPAHRKSPLGDSLGCRYDFSYGNRDPSGLPTGLLKSFAADAFDEADLTGAATYIDPLGLPALRTCIARKLNATREMHCQPDSVVMQPGTQSALYSVLSLFPFEQRSVAIENPGYDGALRVFQSRATHITALPAYRSGHNLLRVLEDCDAKLVFLTPSNQFPLGYIMPLATRLKVIDWAKRHDAYLIEDDYCCEYRYGSDAVPSLQSLCPSRVIYLGTMSKILSPAIRMSYLVLPPALMERWNDVHRYRFCALPWLDQEMMCLFMNSPEWTRYERSTVNRYRKSHDTLIASIRKELGDNVRIVGVDAGLHILLGDNEKRDQSKLINLARSHDVRVYGTDRYWVGKARPMRNFVLVGFSQIREEDIPEGIRRLGEAWYG